MSKGYKKGALAAIGTYVIQPRSVMNHPDYLRLDASTRNLLWEIAHQYNGSNNGSLSPSWEWLKGRGWNKGTLDRAKKRLRDSPFITVTRRGTRQKGNCELWAINWFHVNWRKSMDIEPTEKDKNYMKFNTPENAKIDPIKQRGVAGIRA